MWAALAYSAGLWIGKLAWRPPGWWVVSALAFAASAAYFLQRRHWASTSLAIGSVFLAGALAIQIGGDNPSGPVWIGDGQEVMVTAHVVKEGNLQSDGPGFFHQRVDVETEEIESVSRAKPVSAGVRLNIYSGGPLRSVQGAATDDPPRSDAADQMPLLHYGQRIRFSATLNHPRNFRNPGAFDYAGYLRDQGIAAVASAKYAEVELLPGFSGNRLQLWRAGIHRSLVERIHALWPESVAGLMDAIVIGEDAFIDRPTRINFQRSGTYHILVVSGMNVSILAVFTMWLLRRFGLGEAVASAFAVVLILVYAALTYVGAPVWRAALMFAVYLATRLLYRDRAMLNALGAAALGLLIVQPQALFGASFQMTFLCVGLVAGIGIPLLERTIGPFSRGLRNLDALAYDRQLPPRVAQLRLEVRLILGRLKLLLPGKTAQYVLISILKAGLGFIELVLMSAVLQLGLALPMAYYFHRATSLALPANLLVIPFLQVLMPAAVIALSLSYVWIALARIPADIAEFALEGIAGTVKWLGGLRLADIRVATPNPVLIVCSGAAILLCVMLMRRRLPLAVAGLTLLATTALWIWIIPPRQQIFPGVLEMTAIDVGQGDSILVVSPDGHKLLVDAGGLPFWEHSQLDIGEDVVAPYLWSRGISKLDSVALTHAHADHMGGLAAVISNFHPHELWLPEGIPRTEIAPLLARARAYRVTINYLRSGNDFSYGGASVRVLAPGPASAQPVRRSRKSAGPARPLPGNNESLALKLSYGRTSLLLEGDAEKKSEHYIAAEDSQADVLKVAHHGSASSTNDDLLAAVRPRFAVISVGARNVYHHPRNEVLERLQRARVKTYRTDIDGATTFYLDGKRVTSRLPTLP